MRVVKDGEVRKREILLAARGLFISRGYDQTSINDILEVVEIAKGTFYYYFKSKEEVLEAIIIDIVEEGAFRAKKILSDRSVPLLERMMRAVLAQTPDFEGAEEIKMELHRVENVKLHELYMRAMLRRMTEVMMDAVDEGIADGTFCTEYPKECVETFLLLGHLMFDCNTFGWESDELPVKMSAFFVNIERMFGIRGGELQKLGELLITQK